MPILAGMSLPWIWVLLLAYEYVPGSVLLTDQVFGLSLLTTYTGLWTLAIVTSRARRLMLLRALATTLTLVAMLLILELLAALHWVHWALVLRNLVGEGTDYQTAYIADEELGFRRIPHFQWSGRPASDIERGFGLPPSLKTPITFTFDKWGYRNVTELEQAEIVLIGDSYVEGWYVSDEQTVASQLAARLGRPVVNLGVAGYGTMQELRVLQSDALHRQPRIVAWFFFEGNDFYDDARFEHPTTKLSSSRATARPAKGLTHEQGWTQRSFLRNAFFRLRQWSHPLIPNRAPYWAYLPGRPGGTERVYFANYGAVPWTAYEEQRWAKTRATFEAGIKFTHEREIKLLLVYVPIKYRVFREFIKLPQGSPMATWGVWPLPQRFRDFCATVSIPCLDLTNRLQQAVREGGMPYPPMDTHWSPEGHTLVAAELEHAFQSLGWVPPAAVHTSPSSSP